MEVADVLVDEFGRVADSVHRLLSDIDDGDLFARLDDDANSICWLIWHLTRIEDDHIADVAGTGQVWIESGWRDRFSLPFDPKDTGFGHSAYDVASVRTEVPLLVGYFDAVHAMVTEYVSALGREDLDRVVDRRWDPPVTLGVRLVSILGDATKHAGQAEFIRGVLARRASR